MKKFTFFIAVLVGLVVGDPIVKTKYGNIQGFEFTADRGYETEVFLGIPFAKPPIGELRFEKPQPPDPWSKTLEAVKAAPPCLAWPSILNPNGQEDCLYLNIIRPKQPSEDPEGYPVMVFIHGGAFIIGSASDVNYERAADRMVSKGIVLVAIQYRLGPFGFYTTGDSESLGNNGIWDQIQALKFVQEIIQNFGGNPSKVTIFGESAGGASTSILSLTPETENLFSKSIPMSGSALGLWALDDKVLQNSQKFEEASNCVGSSSEKKKCLKAKTAEELMKAQISLTDEIIPGDSMKVTSFNPRIDGDLIEKDVDFETIYKKREKKSALIGICSMEDILFAIKSPTFKSKAKYFPLDPEDAATLNETRFRHNVHILLSQDNAYGKRNKEAIDKICDFYLGHSSKYSHHQVFQSYVELFSDIHFNIASMREALLKTKLGYTVYFYVYDFPPFPNPLVDGASHAADIIALFGGNNLLPNIPFQGDFKTTVDIFAELLINFAKTGVPSAANLKVPKVEKGKIPFIHVNQKPWIGEDLWKEKIDFWDNLAKEFKFDTPSGKWIAEVARDEL